MRINKMKIIKESNLSFLQILHALVHFIDWGMAWFTLGAWLPFWNFFPQLQDINWSCYQNHQAKANKGSQNIRSDHEAVGKMVRLTQVSSHFRGTFYVLFFLNGWLDAGMARCRRQALNAKSPQRSVLSQLGACASLEDHRSCWIPYDEWNLVWGTPNRVNKYVNLI